MVRNLDKKGEGITNWKQLATYIILLRSSLPTQKDIESYKNAFESVSNDKKLLDKNAFV